MAMRLTRKEFIGERLTLRQRIHSIPFRLKLSWDVWRFKRGRE